MGFLESLRDKELRGLYRARKLIENADLQAARGNVPEAMAELEKAKDLVSRDGIKESPHSKDYANVLVLMSGVFLKLQSLEDALKAADKALTLAPADPMALAAGREPLSRQRQHSEASAVMDKALELKGNDRKLLFDKAKVLEEAGKKEEAVATYVKVVEMEPSDIETYDVLIALDDRLKWSVAKAEALLRAKRTDDSLKALEDILSQDPDNVDVMLVKARILMERDDLESASEIYDRALIVQPGSFSANLGKAQVLRASDNKEEAVKYYKEALKADLQRKETWTEVGPLLEELKRLEEAEKVYEHALEIDPRYLPALEGRYRMVVAQEKWPEIVDAASNLLAQRPDLAVHKDKIAALVKSQRFKEALDSTNRRCRRFPGSPELLPRRGNLSCAGDGGRGRQEQRGDPRPEPSGRGEHVPAGSGLLKGHAVPGIGEDPGEGAQGPREQGEGSHCPQGRLQGRRQGPGCAGHLRAPAEGQPQEHRRDDRRRDRPGPLRPQG